MWLIWLPTGGLLAVWKLSSFITFPQSSKPKPYMIEEIEWVNSPEALKYIFIVVLISFKALEPQVCYQGELL